VTADQQKGAAFGPPLPPFILHLAKMAILPTAQPLEPGWNGGQGGPNHYLRILA
jgi:hypothetical protein